jgi:hypothetical protein
VSKTPTQLGAINFKTKFNYFNLNQKLNLHKDKRSGHRRHQLFRQKQARFLFSSPPARFEPIGADPFLIIIGFNLLITSQFNRHQLIYTNLIDQKPKQNKNRNN